MTKGAMKLALEALEHLQPTALTSFYTIGDRDKAITALREALAQPQQEPVAWAVYWGYRFERKNSVHFDRKTADAVASEIVSVQTEVRPLYTSPPAQRTWVGLTDEERQEIWKGCDPTHAGYVTALVEAKLRRKNEDSN